MAKAKITKRIVDGLVPGDRDVTVFDTEVIGFGVRVRKTGGMSYIAQYKGGKGRGAPTRRVTIGPVGRLTPEQARSEAKRILGGVSQGQDPAALKTEEKKALRLDQVSKLFVEQHARAKRKGSTAAWVEASLERLVKPTLGSKVAAKITRQDVSALHSALHGTPIMANRTVMILSSVFAWGAKHGYVPEGFNPCRGVEKYPERAKERFLTSAELGRLGDALRLAETEGLPWVVDETKPTAKHLAGENNRRTKIDPFAAAAIRLLILTGARLREILHARWDEVDFERSVLFLPDSKTGRKPIYLSAAALAILSGLPHLSGNPFVIPGKGEDAPRADLKKPWGAVTRAAGLSGVRIHDLRHSFASFGAGASLGLPIIGKLLGHTQAATTSRYAHLDADPMRKAVETIGATIGAALERTETKAPLTLRQGGA